MNEVYILAASLSGSVATAIQCPQRAGLRHFQSKLRRNKSASVNTFSYPASNAVSLCKRAGVRGHKALNRRRIYPLTLSLSRKERE